MTEAIESSRPTTSSLAPDTLLRVETIDGHFRVIAVDAEIVLYLPAFKIRASDIEDLIQKDHES